MNLLFLGTGTSYGVPKIDCMINDYVCCPQGVCRLAGSDPKHNRTRCSVRIEIDQKHVILVDASPDFREQVLRHRVKRIDAVLLTHFHADHIQGLPDIRSYCRKDVLDVYGSNETIEGIERRFDYMFEKPEIIGGGIPNLRTHKRSTGEVIKLFGQNITPVMVEHGSLKQCFGYRIGGLGYVPDVKVMPEKTKEILMDLDVLVLNMLRRSPEHTTHLTMRESITLAEELNPKCCYFIHMNHDIHYDNDKDQLPDNMEFAYDGLCISV